MARLRRIYIVATEDRDSRYVSVGRRWNDVQQIAAFSSARAAILAEAAGDVFIPGYLVGEDSPRAMSSLEIDAIIERMKDIGLCGKGGPMRASVYEGELSFWSEDSSLWFDELTPEQLAALREVFDRHADPAVVGPRRVYEIDVE